MLLMLFADLIFVERLTATLLGSGWQCVKSYSLSSIVNFESSMAPGASTCKEVLESHHTVSDYDIAMSKSESTSSLNKISPGMGGKHGIYSTNGGMGGKHGIYPTNGVHELLECPVCTSLMYPPIYQVFYSI